jgi:hypothetical protein
MPMLGLLLAISLSSCDAMFSTNAFATLTHTAPTAAEISAMSPADLQAYIASAENLKQLTADASLKTAALDNLSRVYGSSAISADQQTAAIVAAKIEIGTVPDALSFAASVQAKIIGGTALSSASPNDISAIVESALPADMKNAIAPGASMPASFAEMIDAFVGANGAYAALGAGVVADGNGYAAGLNPSQAEKDEIAANAVISGLLVAVTPTNPGQTKAEALWAALAGSAGTFAIPSSTLDGLTNGAGPIAALVAASSFGSKL